MIKVEVESLSAVRVSIGGTLLAYPMREVSDGPSVLGEQVENADAVCSELFYH